MKASSRTERQKEGIRKWLDNNGIGIWCWATGTGKTYGALMLCKMLWNKNPDIKILISVPTLILKQQWQAQVDQTKFSKNIRIEVINTIITKEWETDLLIIDELHSACGNSFIKIFDVVKYRFFLGLSATLERLDGREKLLESYAKVVDIIDTDTAIKNEWLSPYRYYKVLLDVDDLDKYDQLNRKFNSLFAFFNFNFNDAMACVNQWQFRNKYAKKMGYNTKEVIGYAMAWMQLLKQRKAFIMSHPHKFEVAKQIIESRPNKKIITFSATIKDAESLKIGKTLHSKKKKSENKKVIEEFKKLNSGVLNTSKAANAGLDIPDIDCEIRISGTSSSIDAKQILGRGLRYVDDKVTEVFTLVIKGTVEELWFNKAHVGISYITINEEQLKKVLAGESIETRKRYDFTDGIRF